MIIALAVLIPFLAGALLLYLRWRPETDLSRRPSILLFDKIVLLLVVFVWAGSAGYFRATVGQGADRAWWPVLAVLSSLFFTSVVLLAAALLRNLLLFRR